MKWIAGAAIWMSLYAAQSAQAFCGFYISGGDSKLFNDATQVVLMRHGIQTVLSMQNNFSGPPEGFAMVVPVPIVLQQENVKTLPKEIFDKVDQLTTPRLVEYWEEDPCAPVYHYEDRMMASTGNDLDGPPPAPEVQVHAQFSVGEYDIVILSTEHATALETWLHDNAYVIPEGSAPYFQPYVDSGSYFFVAKVDPEKVTFENGHAVLSPLRFAFTSDTFTLPMRLGLINSKGSQDLLVYILGVDQRYNAANRPNVTIPTNIEVVNDVRNGFGDFYRTLFAKTVAQNANAVVTEYSWAASSCDPCPGPTMLQEDYMTLGQDTLPTDDHYSWVITRLHYRYDAESLGEDLVFAEAPAIMGGREFVTADGELERGAQPSPYGNNFQGRYIIRHRWDGEVTCDEPVYARWGGRNGGSAPGPLSALSPNTLGQPATAEAVAPTTPTTPDIVTPRPLEELVVDDIPELGVVHAGQATPPKEATPPTSSGCAGCQASGVGAGSGALLLGAAMTLLARRRRR